MRISHLLNKLKDKSFFLYWFVQGNRQKTTVKKKIAYFLKNYVASLFIFFEKVFAICKLFTARCLDVTFSDFLCSICLRLNPQYWYVADLVVILNKAREETFAASLQKLCLHKTFSIGWTTKPVCREFYFFIFQVKCPWLQYC